jgi:hypothetical protein
MSMRNLLVVFVLLSCNCFTFAAEPDANMPVKKTAAAKPAAVKKSAKPATRKYYYVRGDSLPAVPMADVSAPDRVPQVQAAAPEAGEVHTGRMICELGNFVTITPDPLQPAGFIVQMKKNTYHMTPVATTTGAIRLEDTHAGAMWLQLPHKSMLMNSKLGQRMADECQSEHQVNVAQAMKLNPPPSLLDSPAMAKK